MIQTWNREVGLAVGYVIRRELLVAEEQNDPWVKSEGPKRQAGTSCPDLIQPGTSKRQRRSGRQDPNEGAEIVNLQRWWGDGS